MLTLAKWAGGGRGFTASTTLGLGQGLVNTFRAAGGTTCDLLDPNLPMFRTAGQMQYVLINLSAAGSGNDVTVRTPGPVTLLTITPQNCGIIGMSVLANGTREWFGALYTRAT